MKTILRIHAVLAVAGLSLIPIALLFAQGTPRTTCIAAAFVVLGVAFALNGWLGVSQGKMHMQIGSVVSRDSRGTKMFKMDIGVQFAGAAMCLALATWFIFKALRWP